MISRRVKRIVFGIVVTAATVLPSALASGAAQASSGVHVDTYNPQPVVRAVTGPLR